MATTTVAVTKNWTQVSTGSCIVQAKNSSVEFQVYIGSSAPTTNTADWALTNIRQMTVFDLAQAVYLKIPANQGDTSIDVTVLS